MTFAKLQYSLYQSIKSNFLKRFDIMPIIDEASIQCMFHIQQQIHVQQSKIELYIEFEHIIIDEIQYDSEIKDDIAKMYEGMNNNRKEDFKTINVVSDEDKNGDWKVK
ncbi:hypothetical protein AHAS_Ahas04G0178500 [Arachis hypogaea]